MFKIMIPGLCAVAALAQTPTPSKDVLVQKQVLNLMGETSFGPIGITAALAGPMSTIPGAPYSAQAVTQRIQVLADGNRITQTTTNAVSRDGQGRVRREESLPGLGRADGEGPRLISIEDPVAGAHITLDSNSKTAVKIVAGQMKRMDEMAAGRNVLTAMPPNMISFETTGPGQQMQMMTLKRKAEDEAKAATVDLGTQTIEGVVAKGKKTTRTIPAGEMGNDLPIIITTEVWYSPELKVLVLSKSNDPRMGETTYKLTNLLRGEPDPSLFQIPADYTVKDQPSNFVFYKGTDK